MASYLWRKYADYLYTKWERTILWDMVEPYRRPKSFTPLVTIYIAAFYTGVIGAAITEQRYKVLLCFFSVFMDLIFIFYDCFWSIPIEAFIRTLIQLTTSQDLPCFVRVS